MIASLGDVLQDALKNRYAVAGLVCLGWEDMRAYARAAEAEGVPVILQAGPGCRAHTPIPVLAAMMRSVAESVSVPVVMHLDHSRDIDECRAAIAAGFTGVMYDGSRLSLGENIRKTSEVVRMAHEAGVSVEGEIGFVGYAAGESSAGTDPQEAQRFAVQTGVDAMAISIGNVHLQTDSETDLDENLLSDIEAITNIPLVIHGGSGVPKAQRAKLGRESAICKYNIGTELRQAFGRDLRQVLAVNPEKFDRVEILSELEERIVSTTRELLRGL
ncbi:MAG: class II fructose-bisphosphate aldolase [Oceanospirillaceae bacterium]|nr:class II fructose-bisphosphate aldolase [Oceanospirillaceae bacterium]